MNQGICYLYEYENDQRKRNIGFLQISRHYHSCQIALHLKPLPVSSGTTLELHAFYLKEKMLIHAPAALLNYSGGSIATQLSISESLFPEAKSLVEIDGFLLFPQNSAVPVLWIATRATLPALFTLASDSPDSANVPASSEATSSSDTDCIEDDAELTPPASSSDDEAPIHTTDIEETAPDDPLDNPQQTADSQPLSARKISRKELSILPKKFWGLANNSFLVHGYHNYNHLLLVEEEGHTWLGVPGIYDEREAKAADLFGFPQFTRSYVALLNLSEEERCEQDNFGHWCRYLDF